MGAQDVEREGADPGEDAGRPRTPADRLSAWKATFTSRP
jgi:hypothetical protein